MSSDSHATVTYTSMSSYEVTINEYYEMPMDPLDPYVQLVMGAPPSPDYNDGDDEKSEGDSIDYPTSEGDNDADDNGDDLSEDDADNEDEEESSNSEEEEEEHLALTVPAPALYSFVSESDETEPFKEGRLRRERRYFRTVATTYAQEMEALRRDISTLQRQNIEHAQMDVAPEDGDSCS
nr:hypothetical protein [Tanacetum cinerariifolium]